MTTIKNETFLGDYPAICETGYTDDLYCPKSPQLEAYRYFALILSIFLMIAPIVGIYRILKVKNKSKEQLLMQFFFLCFGIARTISHACGIAGVQYLIVLRLFYAIGTLCIISAYTALVFLWFSLTTTTMGKTFMQTKKGKYIFTFAVGAIWVLLLSSHVIRIYAGVMILSILADILLVVYALGITLGVTIAAVLVTLKLRKFLDQKSKEMISRITLITLLISINGFFIVVVMIIQVFVTGYVLPIMFILLLISASTILLGSIFISAPRSKKVKKSSSGSKFSENTNEEKERTNSKSSAINSTVDPEDHESFDVSAVD